MEVEPVHTLLDVAHYNGITWVPCVRAVQSINGATGYRPCATSLEAGNWSGAVAPTVREAVASLRDYIRDRSGVTFVQLRDCAGVAL